MARTADAGMRHTRQHISDTRQIDEGSGQVCRLRGPIQGALEITWDARGSMRDGVDPEKAIHRAR